MNYLKILFVAFLISFIGCSTPSNKRSDKNEKAGISFDTYLKTLDKVSLPLYHNPEQTFPKISYNYNKEGFKKFKSSWESEPIGILFRDKNTVALIEFVVADFGYAPFIITYDINGNKIDSLAPYEKTGYDIGYRAMEYLTIREDKSIIVKDSVVTYDINSDSTDIIDSTAKLKIGFTNYKIDSKGYFRKSK